MRLKENRRWAGAVGLVARLCSTPPGSTGPGERKGRRYLYAYANRKKAPRPPLALLVGAGGPRPFTAPLPEDYTQHSEASDPAKATRPPLGSPPFFQGLARRGGNGEGGGQQFKPGRRGPLTFARWATGRKAPSPGGKVRATARPAALA